MQLCYEKTEPVLRRWRARWRKRNETQSRKRVRAENGTDRRLHVFFLWSHGSPPARHTVHTGKMPTVWSSNDKKINLHQFLNTIDSIMDAGCSLDCEKRQLCVHKVR